MKKLAVLVCSLLLADLSYGAGYALYEYSGRSTAMGGAVMANDAEPASLAANPSLITELEGTQLQAGVTVVQAHAKTTVNGDARSLKDDTWFLPNLYATHKWSDDISLGLGIFSRYGLGGTYKNHQTWIGSNLAYKVKLETISFTPTIAIKANEQVSVAMGLEAMTIDFTQNAQFMLPTNQYEIHGTGIAWGGNFSLTYRPEWAEKWALGAMYRTKVKQQLNGRVSSSGTFAPINIHSSPAEGAITLPDSISAGISFQPTEKWTLEAGIVGTFWSSYDQILIQYKEPSNPNPFIHPEKLYKDTYRLNFGVEYKLN
ncbi:MAG: outer membrane protein transport protein, partial [Elusimicrobiaceae bacterium]|nr:outer membrane protein transport protein [Elusimicrobiaceae bacterium]